MTIRDTLEGKKKLLFHVFRISLHGTMCSVDTIRGAGLGLERCSTVPISAIQLGTTSQLQNNILHELQ